MTRESHSPVEKWLASSRATDTPAGDLIADLKHDRNLPETFETIDDLRRFLRSRHASEAAIDAVPDAWRRWRTFVKRMKS